MFKRHRLLLTAISFLTLTSFSYAQESHVRIVRVSYIEGSIQINNQNVTTNTPLIEGNVLSTGVDSFAEIEFEDGSTLRVAPNTRLAFSQLARLSSGEALTRVDLDEGEIEVATDTRTQGEFAVAVAGKDVGVARNSRIRVLATKENPLELAVWTGEATVHDPESGQDVAVEKTETFLLAADDPQQYDLEQGIEADGLDQFSEMRNQYVARNYVSSDSSTSTAGAAASGFVDPCQPYYWYPGLPQNCFSPFAFDPFLFYGYAPYGYVYVPGYYYRHHHPPIIHPPTPATAARTVSAKPGRVPLMTERDEEPGTRHIRSFNDENFRRSAPVREEHEAKAVTNESGESRSAGAGDDPGRSRHAQPAHSTDSRHSSSAGSSSPSMRSAGAVSHSSASSYSGSSSHSSSFSSSGGGSSHSSSSSPGSLGSSGRSK